MNEHPIEGLMNTAMNNIRDMIDVNTIIGEPIETFNNTIIIPVSKVGFGFAAGGSEFKGETIDEYSKKEKEESIQYKLPFGGGSGAGVSITPVAFLVIQSNCVKLMRVEHGSSVDKLLDYVPDLIEKANCFIDKTMNEKISKKDIKTKREKLEELEEVDQKKVIRPKKVKIPKYEFEQEDYFDNNNDNDVQILDEYNEEENDY